MKKLPNGQWKVYMLLFMEKGTRERLYLKPGITQFQDANNRLYYNDKLEEESFLKHFDTRVLGSRIFPNKEDAEWFEKELLNYLGPSVDIGFKTSGSSEVREYHHERWIELKDKIFYGKAKKNKDKVEV